MGWLSGYRIRLRPRLRQYMPLILSVSSGTLSCPGSLIFLHLAANAGQVAQHLLDALPVIAADVLKIWLVDLEPILQHPAIPPDGCKLRGQPVPFPALAVWALDAVEDIALLPVEVCDMFSKRDKVKMRCS